jgi:putative transposase
MAFGKKKLKTENTTVLTYRMRVKGASAKRRLDKLCPSTNLVFNYCNEISFNDIRNKSKWISTTELQALTAGSGKELGLNSQTVQAICEEYTTRRRQFKKRKLRWRVSQGPKRSLGWIPFKAASIKFDGLKAIYAGQEFRVWNSWTGVGNQRTIDGKILNGCFSQDSKGSWYLNLTCEVPILLDHQHLVEDQGCDLGLKTTATFSDGSTIENIREFKKLESKLASAQKHRKKRLARNIHVKIKNKRNDYLQKATTNKAREVKTIFVGDVSGKFLQTTNGKSSSDASTGTTRQLLKYKAIRHQGLIVDVSERSIASTVTCSTCFKRTGPSGLSGLGIREWSCGECLSFHNRDTNSAINHLRVGRDSLRAVKAA